MRLGPVPVTFLRKGKMRRAALKLEQGLLDLAIGKGLDGRSVNAKGWKNGMAMADQALTSISDWSAR
jgi:hypothetical protein